MSYVQALAGGFTGAVVLNGVHETVRQFVPEAPRVHVIGERAVSQLIGTVTGTEPDPDDLYVPTLVGDFFANGWYYSLIHFGGPHHAVRNGTLLGLAAGIGAVALPGPLGLGTAPVNRTPTTTAMTIAWYTLGGLVAGAAYRWLTRRQVTSQAQAAS